MHSSEFRMELMRSSETPPAREKERSGPTTAFVSQFVQSRFPPSDRRGTGGGFLRARNENIRRCAANIRKLIAAVSKTSEVSLGASVKTPPLAVNRNGECFTRVISRVNS